MEFFAKVARRGINPDTLYQHLTIGALPEYSPSIEKVLSTSSDSRGEIYSHWGQFEVTREKIRNGVRFALLNCPHAFVWTIAVHESPGMLVIHCTIDKEDEDREFVESIEQFVAEWKESLTARLVAGE